METELTVPDRIIHLKKIEIFEGLTVGELAAVASIAEEQKSNPAEIIIKEGDVGETLYLMIEGEVSVIKGYGTAQAVELDRMQSTDYFGEMALFEEDKRSATIETLSSSRFLILHKQEFKEVVREYPQIALHVCKVLSARVRRLSRKLADGDF